MSKIPLAENSKLSPGDIIEISFDYTGQTWLAAAQIAIFEERLKRNPQYELLRYEYKDTEIIAQLRVTDKAAGTGGITVGEIALWAVYFPLSYFFAYKEAYKIVADTVKTVWDWKYVVIAAAGIFLFVVWSRR
jgi:hypothetical protein